MTESNWIACILGFMCGIVAETFNMSFLFIFLCAVVIAIGLAFMEGVD